MRLVSPASSRVIPSLVASQRSGLICRPEAQPRDLSEAGFTSLFAGWKSLTPCLRRGTNTHQSRFLALPCRLHQRDLGR